MNVPIEKLEPSNSTEDFNGVKNYEKNIAITGLKRNGDESFQQVDSQQKSLNVSLLLNPHADHQEEILQSQDTQVTSVVKHSLLQFALQHFRTEYETLHFFKRKTIKPFLADFTTNPLKTVQKSEWRMIDSMLIWLSGRDIHYKIHC